MRACGCFCDGFHKHSVIKHLTAKTVEDRIWTSWCLLCENIWELLFLTLKMYEVTSHHCMALPYDLHWSQLHCNMKIHHIHMKILQSHINKVYISCKTFARECKNLVPPLIKIVLLPRFPFLQKYYKLILSLNWSESESESGSDR